MNVKKSLAIAAVLAAASTVVVAPAAHAATARQCLDHLAGNTFFASDGGYHPSLRILSPDRRKVLAIADAADSQICAGAVVSIAISRDDAQDTDVRNVNTTRSGNRFVAAFDMRWTDTAMWQVRQFAVYKDGVLAIVGYRGAAPAYVVVKRASVLTGRPGSTSGRSMQFHGYLKAYSSQGTLVPMAPGREVQLQLRPHGYPSEPYRTVARGWTSASGYWTTTTTIPYPASYDVRVGWASPYRTIASDFTWIGVVF